MLLLSVMMVMSLNMSAEFNWWVNHNNQISHEDTFGLQSMKHLIESLHLLPMEIILRFWIMCLTHWMPFVLLTGATQAPVNLG